ncbi:MAG TPA: alanine--tRNA ligase [bacterium]|nr:alanine--tRNA ligase [bacterium]
MKAQEIRDAFLGFFRERGHTVVPGDDLVPASDPTLLFTSAGMVQFKPLWVDAPLSYARAASVQKCLRVGGKQSDLENVGKTLRHHTFFEMLGNFSFGDYFKREAVDWAWEFVTEVMGFDRERLWVSVFQDDQEAFDLWRRRTGIAARKIVRLGEKDNFWGPAGSEGPCGPCSEIYFDRGESWGCGRAECAPGCDCERYIEFWNLVFPQYYQNGDGTRSVLPRRGIDTGMGLERLALVAQGAASNYGTDLFIPIVKEISSLAGRPYGEETQTPYHAIADHARALTFTIAENILPANEGRGYIVRRLLRRAARFGRSLGLEKPFLYRLVPSVVGVMEEAYPNLLERREHVARIVKAEEERFGATLSQGLEIIDGLAAELAAAGRGAVPGAEVFRLSDTYGFPPELTEEVAAEKGLEVDWDGFRRALEEQRRRGREAWKGMAEAEVPPVYRALAEELEAVPFTGYEHLASRGTVAALVRNGERVESAEAGEEADVVLDRTPFYAEAGGQVGDTGTIETASGEAEVLGTVRPLEGLTVHRVRVGKGSLSCGEAASALVDQSRRRRIQAHHTATHLLQHALREIVGDHVAQAGSFVGPDYFRFDFTHFEGLTPVQIRKLEERVNEMVTDDSEVRIWEMPLAEAKAQGALAFFGEKYADRVRMVDVGGYSRELCGGTHVARTGEIGMFRLRADSSVASGVRRIEAVCGPNARADAERDREVLASVCAWLKTSPEQLLSRLEKLGARVRELEKERDDLARSRAREESASLLDRAREVAGVRLVAANLGSVDMGALRAAADMLVQKLVSGIAVLGAASRDKAHLVAVVTPDLVKEGWRAGDIVRETARLVDGSGGGRPDLAQAGGKSPEKLNEAVAAVPGIVETLGEILARR